ncbi:dienelactone hydrolase family protein [Sphingomonas colocasiae]|uniref:Dienelactone hydrolase family protein n=1 Tax=Sphingomonas colocasiae TaxID=1848973 RepID=A0ABS7PLR8_9SPHN|nr:dienelactone hydrolase family protein [Sphingomonas colocasiae]MBY8822252.1 dienelactone hydrolase family protein [Sphingomonas colocasiae]
MAIQRRTLVHEGPGGPFEGVVAWDDAATAPRPGVLVLPNVLGQKEADNVVAERLAALGYVGFAADVFGQGKRTTRQSPAPARYMDEMNADRALLRDRLHRSLAELKALDEVDAARTAAIGFCFGGKCAIDLARGGADLLGVVSFHGVYDPPPFANVSPIRAKLLICHGWDDPIAPPDATVALAQELSAGDADWQIHAYGRTAHGFTDETANMPERGVVHQPDSARRSWKAMRDFLEELFG